jgi:tetratricopeptide (TPR) repeat protein
MRIIALILILIASFPADACIWVKGTTKDSSHQTRSRMGTATQLRHLLKYSIETDLHREGAVMESSLRSSTSFDDRSDYAVALTYLGRTAEAIDLLQKLESEGPGDYAVAANLGTAYELAGKNHDAKKWIEEAIRRNPNSHEGTEWLHVKILEAKIQQDKDPAYFNNHSVLDLDYRTLVPGAERIPVAGEQRAVKRVHEALQYQLEERLKFVKGSDPVVASLLFDYAAIEAGTATLESARGLLEMAAEYGYPAHRIDPLLAQYASIIRFARVKTYFYITAAILGFVAFILYSLRKGWITYRRPIAPTEKIIA